MEQPLLRSETPDYETFSEKSEQEQEQNYIRTLKNKRLFLATFAAVLGNFSFGYALVYTSPVIPALERSPNPALRMNKTESSWFGSVFTLGAAAGGLSAMVLNDLLGRKLSIMFSAVPSVIGYALMAGAQGLWMLLLGRTLTGFAGGLTAACIPVYVSEISHPGVRGALGATPQIMAVFGSLLLYALGLKVPWRWLAVAGEVPVVVMMVLLCFMPNSPRFLLSQGKEEEALEALAWLRGRDTDFHREFQQIQNSVQQQSSRLSWAELRDPFIYKPIAIAVLMRFLQQLTGVTPILVYLQSIFHSTAVLLPAEEDAAIVGAVRLVSVLIAATTMDKAGRKILLFVSASMMLVANLVLGLYVQLSPQPPAPNATVDLSGGALEASGSGSYLMLVPLLATMLFIMGARLQTSARGGEGGRGYVAGYPCGPAPQSNCDSVVSVLFWESLWPWVRLWMFVGYVYSRLVCARTSVGAAGTDGEGALWPAIVKSMEPEGYAMGWGPITWLLMSEILPLKARGVASGLCVLVSWLTAFVLTKSFLLVVNAFGLQVPFYFFAAICLVNLVFTGCCVPETRRRSLEQIESFFRTGRKSFLR